jgi:threonine dehydrogenase-like Zn-dependent dehydrogenase
VAPRTILGHEAVGFVVASGSAVTTVAEGDRVLVSCITSGFLVPWREHKPFNGSVMWSSGMRCSHAREQVPCP